MTRKMPSRPPRRQHGSGGAAEPLAHDKAGYQGIMSGATAAAPEDCIPEGNYEVGYGRPPLHSRFKPGKSGNPKGRPKQSRNLRTIVKQVLTEDMHIRDGDRVRRTPALEAFVRTIRARCFKGDVKALASLMVLLRQSGLMESDETIAELLRGPEYDAIIADYFARHEIEKDTSDD
jgi:Family of unknown function (DUF5681)